VDTLTAKSLRQQGHHISGARSDSADDAVMAGRPSSAHAAGSSIHRPQAAWPRRNRGVQTANTCGFPVHDRVFAVRSPLEWTRLACGIRL